jgi:cobalamin biosynthesis Mg chelatase CobN
MRSSRAQTGLLAAPTGRTDVMVSKLLRATAAAAVLGACIAGCGGQSSPSSTGTAGATTSSTPSATATVPTTSSSTSTVTATATATATATPTSSTTTSAASTTTPHSQVQTSTTSNCSADCQPHGTPTVPGSTSPVGGKCPTGYVYLPPQDNGPALCIRSAPPAQSTATSSTSN